MNRVAYVMPAQTGREADLRQAQSNLPADDLQGLGVNGLECFVGSGYFVMVFDLQGGDFQRTMERFFNMPSVQGFLDKIRPHVDGLPQRGEAYAAGDEKHGGAAAQRGAAAATVTSAQLPLAASAFAWHAGAGGNGGHSNSGTAR